MINLTENTPITDAALLHARRDFDVQLRDYCPHGTTNPLRLFTARHSIIIGRPGLLVLPRNGGHIILKESVSWPDRIQLVVAEALKACTSSTAKESSLGSACLLDGHWASNIYHWFAEWVPRAVALEESGFDGVYLIPDGSVYTESLRLFGVPSERLIPRRNDTVSVDQLTFTECLSGRTLSRWSWLVDAIRRRAASSIVGFDGPQRLYIGRRGDKRRVENEDAVIAVLKRFEFMPIYMEDYPISEQIGLASGAEIILGPHGAAMVFSMFMKPGGALVELFHARYVNPCMTEVCRILDLDYRMLVSSVNPSDNFRQDDLIVVDVPLLELIVRNMVNKRRTKIRMTSSDGDGPTNTNQQPVAEATHEAGSTFGSERNQDHLRETLKTINPAPFGEFPIGDFPEDLQGFQSPDNGRFFDAIFSSLRPKSLLELGSWKGTSAIMFAQRMLSYEPMPVIACVDTWVGSIEHWSNPEWRQALHLRWGYPTLYQRFVTNLIHANVADFVTPLPMTTQTAITLLRTMGAKVDAIYIDASHEYDDVLRDLFGVWELLTPDGFVIVDDFYVPNVKRAVEEFCRHQVLRGLYNADAPWPEAFISRDPRILEMVMLAYPQLIWV